MHDITTRLNTTKTKLEAEKKTKLFLGRLQNDWVDIYKEHTFMNANAYLFTYLFV